MCFYCLYILIYLTLNVYREQIQMLVINLQIYFGNAIVQILVFKLFYLLWNYFLYLYFNKKINGLCKQFKKICLSESKLFIMDCDHKLSLVLFVIFFFYLRTISSSRYSSDFFFFFTKLKIIVTRSNGFNS